MSEIVEEQMVCSAAVWTGLFIHQHRFVGRGTVQTAALLCIARSTSGSVRFCQGRVHIDVGAPR